jgi:hypothetical protein
MENSGVLNWWEEAVSSGSESVTDFEEELAKDGLVSLDGEFLNHDIVRVTANIEELQTPVLGIAFHLRYESETLTFLRYDPGSFLESGGDPFYLVMASKGGAGVEAGELIFGETLRRNDDFPVGDGVVAEFYFQELEPSDEAVYEFDFENGVVSTLDTVRQDLVGIEFVDLVLNEVEEGSTAVSLPDDDTLFDGNYSANAAGSAAAIDGGVIWLLLVVGVLFSASFWYFFKAKMRGKFAYLDQ